MAGRGCVRRDGRSTAKYRSSGAAAGGYCMRAGFRTWNDLPRPVGNAARSVSACPADACRASRGSTGGSGVCHSNAMQCNAVKCSAGRRGRHLRLPMRTSVPSRRGCRPAARCGGRLPVGATASAAACSVRCGGVVATGPYERLIPICILRCRAFPVRRGTAGSSVTTFYTTEGGLLSAHRAGALEVGWMENFTRRVEWAPIAFPTIGVTQSQRVACPARIRALHRKPCISGRKTWRQWLAAYLRFSPRTARPPTAAP